MSAATPNVVVVQPSSLIFLVIIGVWAAFFLQYWMRRRELIATARSVDEFTETMRVLQVREPAPHLDLAGPPPRSYALSPARAPRPQILVKHADAQSHLFAHEVEDQMSPMTPSAGSAATSSDAPLAFSSAPDGASDSAAASAPESAVPDTAAAPVASEADLVMHPSRALRGLTLLVGLAGFVVFLVLAAFGVLRWIAPLVPLAIAVGGFVWLRAGVQAEIAARRSLRQARTGRGAPARRSRSLATDERHQSGGFDEFGCYGHVDAQSDDVAGEPTGRVRSTSVTAKSAALFDHSPIAEPQPVPTQAAVMESAATVTEDDSVRGGIPEVLPVDEDDIPLTWEPRPVPTPTYAMKARIEQRPVATAQQSGQGSDEAELSYPERVRRAVND